jgi:WD40 repeat protein
MAVAEETVPWLAPTSGGVGALTAWTAADGRARLASSGSDGTIQVWDPEAGSTVGSPLVGHEVTVLCLVAWNWSGGRLLASTDEEGVVFVWDLDAEVPVGLRLEGHRGWVQAATFWRAADDAPRLATAGADGTLRVWDPLTGAPVGPPLLAGPQGLAAVAAWAEAGEARLAVADDDGRITGWDPERGVALGGPAMDHGAGVWALATWTAADGAPRLASSGYDGTIRVWNPGTGRAAARELTGHTNWVPTLVAWSAAGRETQLISASTDGTVRVWNAETGNPLDLSLTGAGGLPTLAPWVDTAGRPRIAVLGSGGIRSYDLETGQPVGELLVGHVAGMWALASWPEADGVRLARGGDDGLIRIWNADTGQVVGEPLAGHTAAVWALVAWPGPDGASWLASTGDDGTIRTWDSVLCRPSGPPLTGHGGWVPGLATWRRPDDSIALASAGIDGLVRRWDPHTGTEIGAPLRGHDGWVVSIAAWPGSAGARLATGGADGTIRLWDPVSGEAIGSPRKAHDGWVRSLVVWQDPKRTLLISGGYDGTIRLWDAETGTALGSPLSGHVGRVAALAAWTAEDGGARLASAGADGVIRLWDLERRTQIGDPLLGHIAGIWALSSWSTAEAGVRLASAGQDGTVRLWDPERGHALRTIEIGPVSIWGVSDAPTRRDVIGRQPLADAIAAQLRRPPGDPDSPQGDGPTVVSIEGPWGCGKSTLMTLVREQLPTPERKNPGLGSASPLTVRSVLRTIRTYADRPPAAATGPAGSEPATVTAWLNPWTYQSGEQVWAGLANEIIEAAADVLYPTEHERAQYWLMRNLSRIDRYALGRSLRRRTRSPLLSFGVVALTVPLILSILPLNQPAQGNGDALSLAIAVAAVVAVANVVAGAAHTLWRRIFGRAVDYLPTDLLTGPVAEGTRVGADDADDGEPDPLRRARSGALYLHQHNIGDLIDDLAAAGYGLVVFVDDIDRCQPGTIAEVFEAINLFLSGVASRSGLRAHFVVGLDSSVVASHLDTAYGRHSDPTVALYGDDTTPGWAFLRKLVQLPVFVPEIPDDGVRRLVEVVTRSDPAARAASRRRGLIPAGVTGPAAEASMTAQPAPARVATGRPVPGPRTPVDTVTWRSAEGHPQVRELLIDRLSAQHNRSIREAKRLINVWQFYARMLEVVDPLTEPYAAIARARHLIVLAEIVTRWPALQRHLHRHVDGRCGLQLLAASAADTGDWQEAATILGLSDQTALTGLRTLLRDYEGRAVADLAARLM